MTEETLQSNIAESQLEYGIRRYFVKPEKNIIEISKTDPKETIHQIIFSYNSELKNHPLALFVTIQNQFGQPNYNIWGEEISDINPDPDYNGLWISTDTNVLQKYFDSMIKSTGKIILPKDNLRVFDKDKNPKKNYYRILQSPYNRLIKKINYKLEDGDLLEIDLYETNLIKLHTRRFRFVEKGNLLYEIELKNKAN